MVMRLSVHILSCRNWYAFRSFKLSAPIKMFVIHGFFREVFYIKHNGYVKLFYLFISFVQKFYISNENWDLENIYTNEIFSLFTLYRWLFPFCYFNFNLSVMEALRLTKSNFQVKYGSLTNRICFAPFFFLVIHTLIGHRSINIIRSSIDFVAANK